MTDKIILGDHTKGIYTVYERGATINFILSEPSTGQRVARKEITIDASQSIGLFGDKDGKAVKLTDAASAAKIVGIILTEPATVAGLTANHYDFKGTMLAGVPDYEFAEIKSFQLELNGFSGVLWNGSKFTCKGFAGAADAAAAQLVLDAVIARCAKLNIFYTECGL